jgi:hypothetical protein
MNNPNLVAQFTAAIPFLAKSLSDEKGSKTEFICLALSRGCEAAGISSKEARTLIMTRMIDKSSGHHFSGLRLGRMLVFFVRMTILDTLTCAHTNR